MTPGERQRVYAFFSRLWVREVDGAFREALEGPLGRELLGVERFEALDEDFARLTVVELVPYESFYRRVDGLLEAGASNPALTFMRKYGFEVELGAARALAPDHLGIELEFLAELCAKEQAFEAAGNGPAVTSVRRTQREFLQEHLLTWAPSYLFAARRHARTEVYGKAAVATLQFLAYELEQLA